MNRFVIDPEEAKELFVDLSFKEDGTSDCKCSGICGCSDSTEVSPEGFGEVLPDIGKNVKDEEPYWKNQPRNDAGQWTSSGVEELKKFEGEYIKPPFNKPDNSHEILSDIEDYLVEHEGAENSAPVEEVPLEDIETLQTRNNKSKVLGILKSDKELEPALVFKKDGKNYLFDGNHRAHAEKLRGKKYFRARVINLSQNSITDSFYPESSEPLPTTNWHNNHPPANPPHPTNAPGGNHPQVSLIAKYKTGLPGVRHNGVNRVGGGFNEKDHPRVPAGSSAGGQFTSAAAADGEDDPLTPGAFRSLPDSKKRGKMWP